MRIFSILAILSVFSSAFVEGQLIYRRYEKKHPRKNYVQIVEIFDTQERPPKYLPLDHKPLNDFLGKDAFRTDMNCTQVSVTETTTSTSSTTTPFHIPTTAFKRQVTTTTRRTTTPNLNNLFTVRSTKPTIRPNPKENLNPDYSDLNNAATPHVQMTKHAPGTTEPPMIVIQETDDNPDGRRNTLEDIEDVKKVTTPATSTTEETTEMDYEDYDNNHRSVESTNGDEEEEGGPDYNENNYDLLNGDEGGAGNADSEEYNNDSGDYEDRRRKRLSVLREKVNKRRTRKNN